MVIFTLTLIFSTFLPAAPWGWVEKRKHVPYSIIPNLHGTIACSENYLQLH